MPSYLAIDSGSPIVSVAVGNGSEAPATRTLELRRSSEQLLEAIEDTLSEAGSVLTELDGIVALRGPGSFTGLRIGLATALGLHQATRIPATGLSTLAVQARAVAGAIPAGSESTSVVDAMKGDWYAQTFRDGVAIDLAQRIPQTELSRSQPARLVGFGTEALAATLAVGSGEGCSEWLECPPLAETALCFAAELGGSNQKWDTELLCQPIYYRAPAARPLAAAPRDL